MKTAKKSIRIKIAVAVSEDGVWEASGSSNVDISRVRRDLLQCWEGDCSAINVHTLEVELSIPEPAPDPKAGKLTYFRRIPHPVNSTKKP